MITGVYMGSQRSTSDVALGTFTSLSQPGSLLDLKLTLGWLAINS